MDNSKLTHREIERVNDIINELFESLETQDEKKLDQFKEWINICVEDCCNDYFCKQDEYDLRKESRRKV